MNTVKYTFHTYNSFSPLLTGRSRSRVLSGRPRPASITLNAGWWKPLCIAFACTVYFPILLGCDDLPESGTPSSDAIQSRNVQGFVAVVGAGRNDPLWPILKNSAQNYARYIQDMEVRFLCPEARTPHAQYELIKSLDSNGLRGLCIQPVDPAAVVPVLKRLNNKGVIVVSMITPLPRSLRSAHVGFDQREIGQALAKATAQSFQDEADIMVLTAGDEHRLYRDRLSAFQDEIRFHNHIYVLAQINCHAKSREARQIIRRRSARYPRLSAWVALDDWPLEDLGMPADLLDPACKFITFGGTPRQWPLVEKGISPALVAANYKNLGNKALLFCISAINRPIKIRNVYNAPLRTVWPTNLEEYKRDWVYWSTGQYPQEDIPAKIMEDTLKQDD